MTQVTIVLATSL